MTSLRACSPRRLHYSKVFKLPRYDDHFLYYLQVKKRFMDLLNLFKASSGEGNRDSINEDSCSEEEEDDDSETVGESEGEQPRD